MITQVDPVLSENGECIVLYGYEGDREDVVNIALITLPRALDEAGFNPDDWCNVTAARWSRWLRTWDGAWVRVGPAIRRAMLQ